MTQHSRGRRVLLALALLLPATTAVVWWAAGRHADAGARARRAAEKAETERRSRAASDGQMLAIAAQTYAYRHDGRLPPARNWEQALRPYLARPDVSIAIPSPPGGRPRRFALNRALAGKKLDGIAVGYAVLFFESVAAGPSAADNLESLPDPRRDRWSGYLVVYVDGFADVEPDNWADQLRQPDRRERTIYGKP